MKTTAAFLQAVLMAIILLVAYNYLIVRPQIRTLQNQVQSLQVAHDSLAGTVNYNAEQFDQLVQVVNENAETQNMNSLNAQVASMNNGW